ncbi:hypothetical protein Tco_1064201 [Tanacetum coccineum]
MPSARIELQPPGADCLGSGPWEKVWLASKDAWDQVYKTRDIVSNKVAVRRIRGTGIRRIGRQVVEKVARSMMLTILFILGNDDYYLHLCFLGTIVYGHPHLGWAATVKVWLQPCRVFRVVPTLADLSLTTYAFVSRHILASNMMALLSSYLILLLCLSRLLYRNSYTTQNECDGGMLGELLKFIYELGGDMWGEKMVICFSDVKREDWQAMHEEMAQSS